MDFETLCVNLFGIKKPFKKNGTLSVSGTRAYGKLITLVYDMQDMGIVEDSDTLINNLDTYIDKKQAEKRDDSSLCPVSE